MTNEPAPSLIATIESDGGTRGWNMVCFITVVEAMIRRLELETIPRIYE